MHPLFWVPIWVIAAYFSSHDISYPIGVLVSGVGMYFIAKRWVTK